MSIPKSVVKDYIPADEYVIINENDADLEPIVLKLPSPPPMTYIDGYGKDISDQRFKPLVIPSRLSKLEKDVLSMMKEDLDKDKTKTITTYKIQRKFWSELLAHYKEYRVEIDFIRRVWWHRVHGYWFYNHGKPTYITGWHFMYLNFWTMPVEGKGLARPDYYDRDRKEFLFHKYIYETDETFERLDQDGYAIAEEDGTYKMKSVGKRLFAGMIQPKNRRSGNTNKGLAIGLEITTRVIGTDGMGIMSYTGDNAAESFRMKLVPAYEEWPLWLKPATSSSRVADEIKFDVPKNEYIEKGLKTQINFATTGSHKFYDSKKLVFALLDEEGKDSENEVLKRWDVIKNTLAQGNMSVIHGYSYHPSTVDEITDGAFDYRSLANDSNFYRRIRTSGQTFSAMAVMFLPADEALTGYIDSYGYSVKKEIKDYQTKEGFAQTADVKLNGERDALLNDNTSESLRKYRHLKKLFPLCYADCWLGEAGDIGFPTENIDNRLAELRRKDTTRKGNLNWINGTFGGEVEFVDDEENGRFELDMEPPMNVKNKRMTVKHYSTFTNKYEDMWMPMHVGQFILGADPFRFDNANVSKLRTKNGSRSGHSDGGIAVLWNYDPNIDEGKTQYNWQSYKFVLSYRYRERNSDLYSEDVLKAAIYYGAMVYPETNVEETYKFFIKHNFGGYLLYDEDVVTGRLKDKPGVFNLDHSKQRLFTLTRNYLDTRCHVEPFASYLTECKRLTSMDDMRISDRFTAHGLALMGAASTYVNKVKTLQEDSYDLDDFVETFSY